MMICDRCQKRDSRENIEATTLVFRHGEADDEEDMTRIDYWEQDLCVDCKQAMKIKLQELIDAEIKKP